MEDLGYHDHICKMEYYNDTPLEYKETQLWTTKFQYNGICGYGSHEAILVLIHQRSIGIGWLQSFWIT